jgi:hypothetical protein
LLLEPSAFVEGEQMRPCPTCHLTGGFHDTDNKTGKHAQHQVPREVLKESGWVQVAHEELKRERAAKKEEEARLFAEWQASVDAREEQLAYDSLYELEMQT